jgi:hypothetical protein
MTPHTAAPAEFVPIFNWSPWRSRKVSLISFIVGSAVLHALCFYIFQIVYPPTVSLLPPPARVNLITPETEEGRVLLRWIEAEDPALSSTTQRGADAVAFTPPRPAHVPTYLNRQPALRELPPYQRDLSVPSSRPPSPVSLPRATSPASAAVTPTAITFSGQSEEFGSPQLPPLQFTASSKEPPQAAQFRVGIDARGDVRHCFVQVSSGDRALDEQARRYLLLCRFPEIAAPLAEPKSGTTWGTATVEWGNDVAAPDGVSSAARTAP